MDTWSHRLAEKRIYDFTKLNVDQKDFLITMLNQRFPPSVYEKHRLQRRRAQQNLSTTQQLLERAQQKFPHCIQSTTVSLESVSLAGYGIVLCVHRVVRPAQPR